MSKEPEFGTFVCMKCGKEEHIENNCEILIKNIAAKIQSFDFCPDCQNSILLELELIVKLTS